MIYDDNNVYAANIKGDTVYVSDVESGRKGYFCLGCGKEMQAVKSTLSNRISYFRHDPKAVKGIRKCTYSDETERHKIAKEILLYLKYIKVPAIYKYPPIGQEGKATLLKESTFIEAHSAVRELSFYEEEDSTLRWSKSIKDKPLLVRPDITFFDKFEKPILFIELVATHKVTTDKKVKLKRLGIDTIQVKIPKDSPESIKKSFSTTDHTKWIYNNYEESTEYIRIPDGTTEGVLSIDEEQRKLFEESFKCRQSQINNLIRTIGRCLESKPYREIEEGFRTDLFRVKGNAKEHRARLDRIQEEHRNSVSERFRLKTEEFERERDRLESEESTFESNSSDLERRYKSKKSEIEREEKKVDRELNGEDANEREPGNSIGTRRERNRRTAEQLRFDLRIAEGKIRAIEQEEIDLPEGDKRLKESIIKRFEQDIESEKQEMERIEREERELPDRFRDEEENTRNKFEKEERGIETEYEELCKQFAEAARRGDFKGDPELSKRVRGLFEARKRLKDIIEITVNSRRYTKAWESFKSGAYENWIK